MEILGTSYFLSWKNKEQSKDFDCSNHRHFLMVAQVIFLHYVEKIWIMMTSRIGYSYWVASCIIWEYYELGSVLPTYIKKWWIMHHQKKVELLLISERKWNYLLPQVRYQKFYYLYNTSSSYACLKEKYLSTILVSKYVIVTYGQNKNFEDKTWCNHHCNGHTAFLPTCL